MKLPATVSDPSMTSNADRDALAEREAYRAWSWILRDADERGRRGAERERDRDALRHRRHGHAGAERHADHRADDEA